MFHTRKTSGKCNFSHNNCGTKSSSCSLWKGKVCLVGFFQINPFDFGCHKYFTNEVSEKKEIFPLEITLIIKGNIKYSVENEHFVAKENQYYVSSPQSFISENKFEVKMENVTTSNTIEGITFQQPFLRELREKQGIPKAWGPYDFDPTPTSIPSWLSEWRQKFHKEIFDNSSPDPLLFEAMITELYYKLLVNHFNTIIDKLKKHKPQKNYDSRIQKAIEYIEKNYNKEISLDEISTSCGISKIHFIDVFKKETGVTPGKYLTSYRIEKAMELIKDKKKTIEEIAFEVGYKHANSLLNAFLSIKGTSPSKFR